MVGRKRKPRQKQQPKIGKNPPAKRQRQQSIVEQSEPLNITDVNDDCLEKIFEHLSLEDLLNVADANKYLCVAAGFVFRRKFRQKYVGLRKLIPREELFISQSGDSHVSGLKNCLRFVRCFGPQITQLCIDYSKFSRKDYSYLDRYVNKFCAETLKKMQYIHKPTISMDIPEKPFKEVKHLGIQKSNLRNRLGEILNFFPKLRSLKLLNNRIDGTTIEEKIPKLRHLIVRTNSSEKYSIDHKNIVEAVRLNPQLRSLWINEISNVQYSLSNLLKIASQNSSLTSLEVHHNRAYDTDNDELILNLTKALPMMKRLEIPCVLQLKTVLEFTSRAEHLTFFRFIIPEPIVQNFYELQTFLIDEWISTKLGKYVTLERLT